LIIPLFDSPLVLALIKSLVDDFERVLGRYHQTYFHLLQKELISSLLSLIRTIAIPSSLLLLEDLLFHLPLIELVNDSVYAYLYRFDHFWVHSLLLEKIIDQVSFIHQK